MSITTISIPEWANEGEARASPSEIQTPIAPSTEKVAATSWAAGIKEGSAPASLLPCQKKEDLKVAEEPVAEYYHAFTKKFEGSKGGINIYRTESSTGRACLRLVYYDTNGSPFLETDFYSNPDKELRVAMQFYSPLNGGSRWKNAYDASVKQFFADCEWYSPRPEDPQGGLNGIHDVFDKDVFEKVTHFDFFSEEEVKDAYNNIGVVLRRVALRFCRNREFINKKGKVSKNNYKPSQTRKQRDMENA